ncbi:uncharacterized protein BDR25DRAFT_283354 [Lindgomyces ingoldianus]|uniref:Uncharacterized protein n=1 Tax=Lindgomyces ingoldianus TaxID=673940 RepID=A0ACB6R0N3_9PLEO|nr:uncharacterized protein BDR25DRAFT_283354 [Lindgomyces ingoldianus]KAF2472814.1 hypothetical protein BDR25DRAFT_283354 [Lindgomyces ingoldianus]
MPIRLAAFSDHSAIATVCSAAFFDEDLFGRVMHPHRHKYPNDPTLWWHAHDGGKEKVVGVGIWERQGKGGKKMQLSIIDPRNLLTTLTKITNRINSILYPNRALDASKSHLLSAGMPFSRHHWAGEREDNWYLSLLAVHPDWQGHGFGRELVEWGLQQAEKENVHASVMSSDGKENFYLKCGFEEIVGNATEGEGNPLAGIRGGAILFRYPMHGVEAGS